MPCSLFQSRLNVGKRYGNVWFLLVLWQFYKIIISPPLLLKWGCVISYFVDMVETEISPTQFPLLLVFLTSFNVTFFRRGWVCKWKWNALQKWSVCEHHWVLPVSLQWRLWGGSGWKDLCWWVLSFRVEKKCSKPWAGMLSETVESERTFTLPSSYLAEENDDKRTRWLSCSWKVPPSVWWNQN